MKGFVVTLILLFMLGCTTHTVNVASQETTMSRSTNAWKNSRQEYIGTDGILSTKDVIYVDIDLSMFKLDTPPVILTSMVGNSRHWEALGYCGIYNLTKNGFRVYVRYRNGVTATQAIQWGWKLNYTVVR